MVCTSYLVCSGVSECLWHREGIVYFWHAHFPVFVPGTSKVVKYLVLFVQSRNIPIFSRVILESIALQKESVGDAPEPSSRLWSATGTVRTSAHPETCFCLIYFSPICLVVKKVFSMYFFYIFWYPRGDSGGTGLSKEINNPRLPRPGPQVQAFAFS